MSHIETQKSAIQQNDKLGIVQCLPSPHTVTVPLDAPVSSPRWFNLLVGLLQAKVVSRVTVFLCSIIIA